jgi:hypothetical protein
MMPQILFLYNKNPRQWVELQMMLLNILIFWECAEVTPDDYMVRWKCPHCHEWHRDSEINLLPQSLN